MNHLCFGIVFDNQPEKDQKMKNFLASICFLFTSFLSFSQAPNYDDLKVLFADGNYEKLAKVASGYTESEKTAKDVLPYIWLAKGLYKISLSGTDDEKFSNAYKDAIMYLKKGVSYDIKYNDGATIADEREFMDEFQASLMEVVDNDISTGNYKKAYGWAIKYKTITLNVAGANYMMGACKYRDQDKTTARTLWLEAEAQLKEVTGLDSWGEADRKMLKLGILHTAAAMKDGRQMDQARALLNKAAQWFEEDEDWKERYDEIVN